MLHLQFPRHREGWFRGNSEDLYSTDARFESRPGSGNPNLIIFVGFHSIPTQMQR
jgi:hypothetical protein